MKKGYQALPAIRYMAEEMLAKGYGPTRVRAVLLRVFAQTVSIATIKRWRAALGNRPPQPFSLEDLGLVTEMKEQDISRHYIVGTRGLLELTARYPGLDAEDYMKALAIYFAGAMCHWPDLVELAHELCRRRMAKGMAIKPLPSPFPPQPVVATVSGPGDVTDAGNYWRIEIRLQEGVSLNPREAEAAGTLRQIVQDHPISRMTLLAGGADALYVFKPAVSGFYPGAYTYYYHMVGYPGIGDGWYSLSVEVNAEGNLTAVNGDAVCFTQSGHLNSGHGQEGSS